MGKGAAGTRGPIHKITSCFPSWRADGSPRPQPNPEPGARGLQARRTGRHVRPGSAQTAHTSPKEGGFAGGASRVGDRFNPRAVTAGQGPRGPEPCAPPRQRPLAPERTQDRAGSDRPQPGPSPPALPPQPSRLRARSPRIRWLPHCTPPASVLRGRLGSGFDSGSGCRTAACPTLGTGRPAPPRRWTCPAPAAAAANQRAVGAEQAARQAQPIQLLPARRGAAAEMGGRLVGSVKGAAAHRDGGEGRLAAGLFGGIRGGKSKSFSSLPARPQRFPWSLHFKSLVLQPSNKWKQN